MVTATLYIEGGGSGKSLEIRFRKGWKTFFDAAGVGAWTRIVRGGDRDRTFKRFKSAIRNHRRNVLPLLLVDSEGPVRAEDSPWGHLARRRGTGGRGWERPDGAHEDQAFLMVQFMETWFLADKDGLRRYFGEGFKERPIRQWQKLEDVSKGTVEEALKQATTDSRRGVYEKGRDIKLLECIDPACVRGACPHADALLQKLERVR